MRTRAVILDATVGLLVERGSTRLSVAAVAAAAGVSRQSVYSGYGSLENLVREAVRHVTSDIVAGLAVELRGFAEPAEYVVELLVRGRAAVRQHPALRALTRGEPTNPLLGGGLVDGASPVVRELLAPLERMSPPVDPVLLEDLVDVVVRTAASLTLFDSARLRDDEDLRAYLQRWLRPVLLDQPSDRS